MIDFIVIVALFIVIGLACCHMYKEHRKGNKCMGCSSASFCSGSCEEEKKDVVSKKMNKQE